MLPRAIKVLKGVACPWQNKCNLRHARWRKKGSVASCDTRLSQAGW